MVFGSEIRRIKYINVGLLLLTDIIVAFLIAWWMDAGLFGLFLVFLALQALGIAIRVIHFILYQVFFWLRGKSFMARLYRDFFRRNKFPKPEEFEDTAVGFITRVMNNPETPIDTRLAASFITGFFGAAEEFLGFRAKRRLYLALEDGLSSYGDSLSSGVGN